MTISGTLQLNTTQYYYGNYRYYAWYQWPVRSLMESISEMKAVDDEDRVSVRSRKASSTGFTGLSILHRWHYLYSFNILKDTVFDAMHTILLRIAKRHLDFFKDNGFFNQDVEKRLSAMPWAADYNSPQLLLSLLFPALSISYSSVCTFSQLLLINTTQFTHCCLELKDDGVPGRLKRFKSSHSQHQSMFLVDYYQRSIIKFGFS